MLRANAPSTFLVFQHWECLRRVCTSSSFLPAPRVQSPGSDESLRTPRMSGKDQSVWVQPASAFSVLVLPPCVQILFFFHSGRWNSDLWNPVWLSENSWVSKYTEHNRKLNSSLTCCLFLPNVFKTLVSAAALWWFEFQCRCFSFFSHWGEF